MAKFTATDTKAIHRIDVDLVPGKVVVFNGPNGGGKSTALNCLRSVMSGKNIGDLEPRDGTRAGLVEFDGVTLKVGKRVSFSGKSEGTFVLIEGGEDVRDFIDPGVKDKVAADERRIEKLCALVGAEITDEQLREFVGDDMWDDFITSRKDMKGSGIVATVKFLKRWLESQARDFEAKVAQCTGGIDAIGPVPVSKETMPDVDALQHGMLEANRLLTDAKQKRDANQMAADQLREFGDAIPDIPALQVTYAAELTKQQEINADIEDTVKQIASLQTFLAGLKSKQLLAIQQVAEAERKISDAEQQNERLDALRVKVANAVSDEAITELENEYARASAVHADGIVQKERLDSAAANRTRLLELRSQREKMEASAATCRTLAEDSHTLLRCVVNDLDGWSISNDMRLCCESARSKQEAFDDLSPGLQAIRALELSCAKKTKTGAYRVVICPQEVYESLDGKNQKLLEKWAAENNICIATGECQQVDTCEACGYEQTMGKPKCLACGEKIGSPKLTVKTLSSESE